MLFYENHKVFMNGEYPAIYLEGKTVHVHRLEWLKHHGEIPSDCIIHHKDENKLNWDIENLELMTRTDHIRKHNDIVHKKPIKVIAKKDCVILSFKSIEEAAEFCGTYTSCIHRIFNGKQKLANGWTFQRG